MEKKILFFLGTFLYSRFNRLIKQQGHTKGFWKTDETTKRITIQV